MLVSLLSSFLTLQLKIKFLLEEDGSGLSHLVRNCCINIPNPRKLFPALYQNLKFYTSFTYPAPKMFF